MGLWKAIKEYFELSDRVAQQRRGTAPTPQRPAPAQRRIVASSVDTASGPPPGYVSPYISAEQADELLMPGADGLPPLRLLPRDDGFWLSEDTTGLLVNVGNRHLRRCGIWSVSIRGVAHYDTDALRLGPAELVREPENEHDPYAVAIHVDGVKVGYYNKQMARALSKELDSGADLVTRIIDASGGKAITTTPAVMKHLLRAYLA